MSNHPVLDSLKRIDKGPPVIPKAERLTASPFQIDHRGELVAELVHDADILDKQAAQIREEAEKRAAELTHKALSLRLAADHLEANPPE